MPTPFMCHWCDKPTMNESGVCIECEQRYEEGNKEIAETVRELESRVRWLEKGLKGISDKRLGLDDTVQAVLDGEPTTADEHNTGVIKLDDEYHAKAKIHLEKVEKGLEILKKSERKKSEEDDYSCNVVYISDVNKEIAKEWKNDTMQKDEKLVFEEQFEEGGKFAGVDLKDREREDKIKKKANMIQSIGYRGEDE